MSKVTIPQIDDKIEAEPILQQHGIEWEIVELPLKQFDLNWGVKNRARHEQQIDPALKARLMVSIQNGKPVPMGVAVQASPNSYGLIDGCHRYAAADESGVTHLKYYLVKVTNENHDLIWNELQRFFNRYHGQNVTDEQAVHNASHLMKVRGYTVSQAAECLNLDVARLRSQLRARHVAEKLIEGGARKADVDRCGYTLMEKIGLIPLDGPMVKFGCFAVSHGIRREDIQEAVAEIKTHKKSEATMLEAVEIAIKRLAPTPEAPFQKRKMHQSRTLLSNVKRLRGSVGVKKRLSQFNIMSGSVQEAEAIKEIKGLMSALRPLIQ